MPDMLRESRWQGRPVVSAALRIGVFAFPIGCSIAASLSVVRLLPKHSDFGAGALRWTVAIAVSTITLVTTDRIAKRLLPLAVLLQLSLAFPNEAPSRLKLARQAASTKDLELIAERARRRGVEDEPARAAEDILALVAAVESHDRGTRGHSERVRIYTDLLADELKLARHERDRLRWAALLHDVGKLMVPREVLNKTDKLQPHEWEMIHRHPEEGARLAISLHDWLGEWAAAIEQHHERHDGAGYPRGLSGAAISRAARIVAVADSYETMTARRPYRKPMRATQARAELVRCSGEQFDPAMVRAFLQISVRRLRTVSGPLAWLAQTPFLRGVEQVATSGAAAVVGGTALVLGLVPSPALTDEPPRAARAPAFAQPFQTPLTAAGPTPGAPVTEPTAEPQPEPEPEPTPPPPPEREEPPEVGVRPAPSPSPSPSPEPGLLPVTIPTAIPSPGF